MTRASWMLFSSILWIGGYFYQRTVMPDYLDQSVVRLVYVPKWFFFLMGYPRNISLPVHVLTTGSIFIQVFGLLMGVYGFVCYGMINDPKIGIILGFFAPMLVGLLVSMYFKHSKPYKN